VSPLTVQLLDANKDGTTDQFILTNTLLNFTRSISTTTSKIIGNSGAVFDRTLGTNLITGLHFETRLFRNLTVDTSYAEGNYPCTINMTANSALYAEVTLYYNIPTVPGYIQQYRIYEAGRYIEIDTWFGNTTDMRNTNALYTQRSVYLGYTPTALYTKSGFQVVPASGNSVWDQTNQYLIAQNTTKSVGMFSATPGPIRYSSTAGIFDSYYYTSTLENNFLSNHYQIVVGDPNFVQASMNNFGSCKVTTATMPQRNDFTSILPSWDWIFTRQDPVPIAFSSSTVAAYANITVRTPTGSVLWSGSIPYTGSRLYSALAPFSIPDTAQAGVYNITAIINGVVAGSSSFEVRIFNHPRIYLTNNKFSTYNSSARHALLLKDLLTSANNIVTFVNTKLAPVLTSDNDNREQERYLETLAFAYRMTNNTVYLNATILALNTFLNYSSWQMWWAGADLQTSQGIISLSIAYDWLYDYLTPYMRYAIRSRVMKETIATLPFYGVRGTLASNTNYYLGNHGYMDNYAIAMAAYTYAGETRVNTQPWKSQAEGYFNITFTGLYPDGSTHEGCAYWSYGLEELVKYAELVYQQGDRNWYEIPYFRNTYKYRLHCMIADQVQVIDFGDVDKNMPYNNYATHSLYKLASYYNKPVINWLSTKTYAAGSVYPYTIMWYNDQVGSTDPSTAGEPLYALFEDGGIAVARSSWNTNATVWSFKSAKPVGGHDHPDQNNFIISNGANHLIVDEGYTYNKVTINHNVILVDGIGQIGEGQIWLPSSVGNQTGTIVRFIPMNGTYYIQGQAALSYNNVNDFTRHQVFITKPSDVIVSHDKVSLMSQRTVDSFLHTKGVGSLNATGNNQFIIKYGASYMTVQLFNYSTINNTIESQLFVPELTPQGKYNPNMNTSYPYGQALRTTLQKTTGYDSVTVMIPYTIGMSIPNVTKNNIGVDLSWKDGTTTTVLFGNSISYANVVWTGQAAIINTGSWAFLQGSLLTWNGMSLASNDSIDVIGNITATRLTVSITAVNDISLTLNFGSKAVLNSVATIDGTVVLPKGQHVLQVNVETATPTPTPAPTTSSSNPTTTKAPTTSSPTTGVPATTASPGSTTSPTQSPVSPTTTSPTTVTTSSPTTASPGSTASPTTQSPVSTTTSPTTGPAVTTNAPSVTPQNPTGTPVTIPGTPTLTLNSAFALLPSVMLILIVMVFY
jgi:hypothetical protein